jgi:hypothetical protein
MRIPRGFVIGIAAFLATALILAGEAALNGTAPFV